MLLRVYHSARPFLANRNECFSLTQSHTYILWNELPYSVPLCAQHLILLTGPWGRVYTIPDYSSCHFTNNAPLFTAQQTYFIFTPLRTQVFCVVISSKFRTRFRSEAYLLQPFTRGGMWYRTDWITWHRVEATPNRYMRNPVPCKRSLNFHYPSGVIEYICSDEWIYARKVVDILVYQFLAPSLLVIFYFQCVASHSQIVLNV